MTEKELRKLKRSDFLQLLLTQGKDMATVQTRLDESTEELEQLQATNERLIAKLNEKDELIEKLKGRLDNKDATISALRQEIEDTKESRRIELEEVGSIAMAALSLNEVFETAQKAADQCLYNIRFMHDELETKYQAEKAEQGDLEEIPQPAKPASRDAELAQAPKPAWAPKVSKSVPIKQVPLPKFEAMTMRPVRVMGFFDKLRWFISR